MATAFALLYLAPSHNPNDTRPLPITLGRKSLVAWWWMACPCMGATTRTPCSDCKFLGTQALALSKTMFHVNSQGILTLDSQSKNRTLVRVNGIGVFGKKQLWDGDVLTIGRYSSVSWMTLEVKTKRVVTPETKKLPTKKLIKRRREASDGVRLEKDSVGTKRVCAMDGTPPDAARKSIVWLKTTPGQGRDHPNARTSSPVDLFESLESIDVLSVTPGERRACEHVVKRLEAFNDIRTLPKSRRPGKRWRRLIGYKDGESTVGSVSRELCLVPRATSNHVDNVDDCVTPQPRDEGPQRLPLASVLESAGSDCPQLNALAVEHANSNSSKKALETQAARHNDTPSCSIAEESVLSLPQCPTYDGESSDFEGGSPFVVGQPTVGEMLDGQDSDPISEVCR